MSSYAFAKEYLNSQGHKIFINGNEILKYKNETQYGCEGITTQLPVGFELEEKFETKEISKSELSGYGLGISRRPMKNNRAKFLYFITTDKSKWIESTKDIKIMFDEKSRKVRLTGINVENLWFSIEKEKTKKVITESMVDFLVRNDSPIVEYYLKMQDKERTCSDDDVSQIINVPEIPILFTSMGELVCIEDRFDIEKISIAGDSGSIKSVAAFRVVPSMFYKWKYYCCNLNDMINQMHTTAQPIFTSAWVDQLEKIGEQPVPMPTINLYTACENLNLLGENDISFVYPLSMSEFLYNYTIFTQGSKEMNLDGKESYLMNVIKKLSEAKDFNDFMDVLYTIDMDENAKKSMLGKWKPKFKKLFDYKFFDTIYQSGLVRPNWEIQFKDGTKYKDDALIIAMLARLFPNVNNSAAKANLPPVLFRNIIASKIDAIIDYQRRNRYVAPKKFMVMIDEMQDFFHVGSGTRSLDPLEEAMKKFSKQGRANNMGYCYTTQSYLDIPYSIRQNNTLVLVGKLDKSSQDRNAIKKDFNLEPAEANSLKYLKKERKELMAFRDIPFIVYDQYGRRTRGNTKYRGFLIPPNCNTFKPGG